MSASASTPRLRLTFAWYVLVLLVVAVSRRPGAQGLSGAITAAAGLMLMSAAALGRIWSSTFIAGLKDARLITSGPYSVCRNPLYGFSLLGALGVGLSSGSFIVTVATMLVLAVLFLRAIRAEETYLRQRHGEAFARYCAEVPRLLPAWRRATIPLSVEVNVTVYRKAFIDAASFILIFVLLKLLDALQAAGWLPTLLELW